MYNVDSEMTSVVNHIKLEIVNENLKELYPFHTNKATSSM
jgi:hypothetical protein